MTYNLDKLPCYAQERLMNKVQSYIDENENGGVYKQENVIHAMEVLDTLKYLNRTQCYKLEKKIEDIEAYKPLQNKYGFGPVTVPPIYYLALLKDI